MTIEEIRNGAPVGATLYEISDDCVYYWKNEEGLLWLWFNFWVVADIPHYELKPLY